MKRTRDQQADPRFDGVPGPFQGMGLPAVRTLSDEYRDVAEPEDSERVPGPGAPGIAGRIARRWTRVVRGIGR